MTTVNDIYQEVTNRIIEIIESGKGELKSLWNKGSGMMPTNYKTKQAYSGVNILLLWASAQDNGYKSNYWLTYKQAQELGGQVRKGEKGTMFVFYSTMEKASKENPEEKNTFGFLKKFTAFNIDQIDGLSVPEEVIVERDEFEANELAESILKHSNASITEFGASAFYRRSDDSITLPERESFISPAYFYSVALHELTHWTGAEHRLNREKGKRFGDQAYAFEELVAELGAAFLTSEIGVINQTIPNHAGYLENWLKILKNDKKAIFTAASMASKAHQYIMAMLPSEKESKVAA